MPSSIPSTAPQNTVIVTVIRSLVNLPIIGHPTRLYVRLPHYRCTNKHYLQKDLPHWPYLRTQQSKNH
ncbi:hypothetical protein I4J41_12305 [Corynebacterium belfantii]|uniref:Uncharacterized protein n=1 Tax=Corynebacterium belfantii TaxID=2014537 RepID=A0ABS0LF85_9CORY|nr:hypothetical protein [Corynebacterium belfantii]